MEKIHMIFWKYDPTTADFNRCWGLAKGIAECGIDVYCDFVLPNDIKCTNVPLGITCNYWGNKNAKKGKLLAYLLSIFEAMSIIRKYKTIVTCPCASPIMIVPLLFLKNKNLYIEKNEYPLFIQDEKKSLSRLRVKLLNCILKRCAGIFVISEKLREYYINIGVKGEKVHVINMVVDGTRFDNIKKIERERYIGYCGTVSNIKDGVNILLEAF